MLPPLTRVMTGLTNPKSRTVINASGERSQIAHVRKAAKTSQMILGNVFYRLHCHLPAEEIKKLTPMTSIIRSYTTHLRQTKIKRMPTSGRAIAHCYENHLSVLPCINVK